MAKSEQQRQKKLAKKRAKELRERQQIARTKQQMASLTGQMQAASKGEVHSCYISGMGAEGMKTVFLARRLPGGQLAVAFFLLDTYCLGVKNAGGRICSPSEFEAMLDGARRSQEMLPAEPSTGRKLVEEAIEYAHSVGLAPHPDYRKVSPIWGNIDAGQCSQQFEFGCKGKPLYMPGPHDDRQRQNFVIQRLHEAVGEGNFDFGMPMGPMTGGFLDDAEFIDSDESDEEESGTPRIE